MKIQTTNLSKGGGGKTTHSFNEGDWLASYKPCMISLQQVSMRLFLSKRI